MKKQEKMKIIYWLIGVAIVVAIIYIIVSNSSPKVLIEVDHHEGLGREHHQDLSDSHYNSNPPTSGDHLGSPSGPGFYETQVSDGSLIHSLEHGYIVINYDCSKIEGDCTELKDGIRSIFNNNPWKVIGNPRPENDHLISVTAWETVMHLDSFDHDKILTFLKKYRNKGPEKTTN
jgi:hypothetical protein